MTRQAGNEARSRIVADLAHVEATGEPVAFESNGKRIAVLVSAEDYALLQKLREEAEDRIDLEAVREARKEPGSVPWEKLKADTGL